ncbi:MAG: alanine:cation symporter family protein, partial [Bacilli bacterium]
MKKLLFKKTKIDKKTLCLSLGVKAGVGTIIGTASSIFIGGCGTILWICLFTIFTCPIIYYESLLGSKYKEKTKTNTLSGPYFYIKKGLNKKYLAIITNIIFILTYSFLFLMIQTNTISEIIKLNIKSNFFNIIILIIIFLILLLIIFFNINNILKLLNKIVPFMCLFFMLISSYIII